MVNPTISRVARDYETDGVPASGNHKIKKSDIRSWGVQIEGIIDAFTAGGGFIYTSRAALFADLAHDANSSAWVIGDATTAYNGIYMKSGASGAGSWTRVADLPFSFIIASDVGAGTANAIQATTSVPVSEAALVWLNIFEANTGAVTVSFNGGTALAIKTNSGNDPSVGGLAAGMIILGIVSGSTFRLVSDQTSSAIQTAAEAAAASALASKNAAAISEFNAAQSAADAAASAIGASPPVALTGLVGSRGMMPTGFQAFTQMNSRTRHFARDNINRVQFLFGNWYFSTGESPGLGNMTLKAALEYPKGRIVQLQWSGNTSVVIGPGDNAPLTDPAFLSIPDGAEFWIRTFQELAEGCTVCEVKDSVGGDLAEYGSGELTDKTASGTITNSAAQFYCYGPLAIVGETHKPSVLILGDSRNHAAPSAVHLDAQSNRGNIAHTLGGQFGYINCAKGGSTMAQLIASHDRIAALKTYCTDVVIQHGINDITGGASGATALSRVDTIIGYFPDKRVWTATIEPVSTSTDGWISGANQTTHASNPQRVIYNDGLRDIRAGVEGNFEFADDVETIRNSGLWKVFSVGVSITSDGTHMNDNGHLLADKQGSIDPRRIYRYPEPVHKFSTRDEYEKGEAASKPLVPASVNRARLFASKSADQTGIAAVTSVTISWENIDMRGGYFDTTNNRWYPPKGTYRVHSQVLVEAGIEDNQIAFLRARQPSGIVIQTQMRTVNTSAFSISVDKVLEFNGIGDYISVDLNITGTGDKTVSGDAAHTFLEVYAV